MCLNRGLDEEWLRQYSLGDALGEGRFGRVRSCRHRDTDEMAAVKIIDPARMPIEDCRREAHLMDSLRHPNIAALRCVFDEGYFVCLVMDRFAGRSLLQGLKRHRSEHGRTCSSRLVHIAAQASAALEFVHGRSILHGDVKCDNFFMDRPGLEDPSCVVVLGDFSLAQPLRSDYRLGTRGGGTTSHWSPERCEMSLGYGHKDDTWALGVAMYTLLAGHLPFGEAGLEGLSAYPPRYSKRLVPGSKAFVCGLLERGEELRMSAAQAAEHPWVAGWQRGEVAAGQTAGTSRTEVEEAPEACAGPVEDVMGAANSLASKASQPEDAFSSVDGPGEECQEWLKVIFGPLYFEDLDDR